MKYLLVSICALCLVKLQAQAINPQIEKAQDSLRQIKVDTFLVYDIECTIRVYVDTCNPANEYLFWRQQGKSFIRKFNVCHTYNAMQLSDDDPVMHFVINKGKIDTEEIKIPVYFIRGDGSKSDEVSAFTLNGCYDKITMITGTAVINKGVSEFNLEYEKFDNGRMNINYKYNQSTTLKALIDKLNLCIHKAYPQ